MDLQSLNRDEKKNKLAFDDYPAFYQDDNRQHRGFNPVSKSFLETKFSVLLPASIVKGKHILDLGSCYGAAGQWVLFNGAASYTGVEVQATYAEQSKKLLAHWGSQVHISHQDVRRYLHQSETDQFDLVIVAGMLYHFIDTKAIIDEICRVCKESVIVETNFPPGTRTGTLPLDAAITEYVVDQEVNLADDTASLLGVSATTSLPALDILFALNGYNKKQDKLTFPITPQTVIYDESALGHTDLQIRFAVHYIHNKSTKPLSTLEDNLPNKIGKKRSWNNDIIATARTNEYLKQAESLQNQDDSGQWRFDADIAQKFDFIARREIPDYQRVIDLCIRIVQKSHQQQPKIIDVGSALGYTLEKLSNAGYHNIYGVESSAHMISKSFKKASLIHSQTFPVEQGPFNYVLANWVLHFIAEREQYLQSIKNTLAPGGTLILTEKVSSSDCIHELYYDFKRANGVTEEEIQAKRRQLEGVLVTYPLSWYLDTLNQLGFENIEVINANTVFVTIMAINQ